MLTALIMAGGRGTRFWPASTEEKPKQFLNLIGNRTMIQETVHRLLPLIGLENIFICTDKKYKNICLEQLPELPERNIILEPTGRNTAPCILLSTSYINQIYENTNIIVLPSDHQINDETEFLAVLSDANEYVESNSDSIVTIGITPNRPETGYGYINFSRTNEIINSHEIKKVKRFVEKPNEFVAQQYLDDGHYLWNAGMFMFNANFMKTQYKLYANETYKIIGSIPEITSSNYYNELEKNYSKCESISVDFAIMEKTDKLYVIPADFGWDDIGGWKALKRYIKVDNNQNVIKGNVVIDNSKNNIIYSTNKPIILLDAEDLFVIETDERVVVGKKESLSKVHELRNK
ncbi:MAG: mannose-1-phosphate guanylyltransferase [Clostridia bacterium]|nr:mannose-1-phosphate guanylyltransferase [Bacilli bacterium]MBR3511509.1 mannose-1-phosphate guanylyltransferase [Clostridia bacterium]